VRRLGALLVAAEDELRRRGVIRVATPQPQTNGHSRSAAAGAIAGVRDLVTVIPSAVPRRVPTSLPRRLPSIPSREQLAAEVPMRLMTATGQLALTLRRLTGRDIVDLESMQDLVSFAYRLAAVRESHADGRYDVDDFGFDRELTESLLPLSRLVYRKYWRVKTTGIENVPRTGGALLVSNHSGVLPLDGAMIKTALFEEGVERHARALIAQFFFGLPALSWFLRRTGQTVGDPHDTHRLLTSGELVLVFPEGVRGTGKPFRERYRLRRFGRGGFVESAIRAGVPIIPISVVGSEEIYPMLFDVRPVARALGMPYFPVTPFWPLLGPLGLIPLPSRWRIQFHEPVRTDLLDPGQADDASQVMELADQVRAVTQAGLIQNLMDRRGVFRG
jgi:1-acyl-sn-glycerol-3-phosphate acyltransferase